MNAGGWADGGNVGLTSLIGNSAKVEKYEFDAKEIRNKIQNYLSEFANKEDYLLQVQFYKQNPNYNMITGHAYTLKSYDTCSGIVTITNPHRTGLDIQIPEAEILPYIQRFSATKIV